MLDYSPSPEEAKLSYKGHVLMENRNVLLVQTFLTEASGRAERDTALLMAVGNRAIFSQVAIRLMSTAVKSSCCLVPPENARTA
jgi:hypothetical protein